MEGEMIDQDIGRLWVEHHVAFGRWVNRAARQVGEAFRVLHRIQYEQPWDCAETRRARH
jgi:hypothetical protein